MKKLIAAFLVSCVLGACYHAFIRAPQLETERQEHTEQVWDNYWSASHDDWETLYSDVR